MALCILRAQSKNWVFRERTILLKSLVKIYVDDRFRTALIYLI